MKGVIITLLLSIAAICFVGCSKTNAIPAVNGTINGLPAIALYGNSGKPTDYVLISTNATDKLLNYDGQTYTYADIATGNSIFIMVSAISYVKGNIDTVGTKTVLTVENVVPVTFASSVYTSR